MFPPESIGELYAFPGSLKVGPAEYEDASRSPTLSSLDVGEDGITLGMNESPNEPGLMVVVHHGVKIMPHSVLTPC